MSAYLARLVLVVLLVLGLAAPAAAQSVTDGWTAYERGDVRQALENWLPLAERGDAEAQYSMAVLYSNGRGVREDRVEALRWSLLAADKGHVGGIVNVAESFTNGWGTKANQQVAHRYWSIAADMGNAYAQLMLAGRYRDGIGTGADPREAMRRFGIVARQAGGQFADEARRAIEDLKGAARKTLEQGVAEWTRGDYESAVTILRPHAESGNGEAQFYLGQAYQFGFGVKRDFSQAVRWFRLAAQQDLAGAVYALGKLLESGGPNLKQNNEQAVKWLTQAAELGVRAATYDLAVHYRDGVGVKRDRKEAQRLFQLAVKGASKGDTAASQARLALAALEDELAPKKKPKVAVETKAPVKKKPAVGFETARVETAVVNAPKLVVQTVSGPAAIMPDCGGAEMPAIHSDQKRVALVVGMAAYQHVVPLRNAACDARAMASTLQKAGFEVISGIDLDRAGLEGKVREFVRIAQNADVSLFFYSGHGLQVDGVNYMVPTDAKVEEATALRFELVDIDTITAYMTGEKKVGIVLLDACRDNPFAEKLERSLKRVSRSASVGRGLAPINGQGGGLVIGFATSPGDTAADGEGAHSPFTTALLETLPTSGVEFELVMKRVKARVVELTERETAPQRPWTNSDLTTEFYFVPAS